MIDPNIKKKREFIIYLTVLIVILPFVFLYLKYADKEPESLAQNFTISRPETPTKETSKAEAQISQNTDKFADNDDITIYKKDLINNSVQLPFEVRDMMVSHDKKRLYTLGHDRDGISVIDISNLDHIKLLGLFYFPKVKSYVEDISAAESNDGKSLYVTSPNLGILRLDVSVPENIKIAAKFEDGGYSKIKLSNDNKLAYAKAKNGMHILDISSDNIKKIGEFISQETFAGDIAIYSDKYVLMSNFTGLHTLDVSDPKNIKEVYKQEDFKVAINLQISNDKKYLYANEIYNFKIYSINSVNDIEPLKNYITNNRIYTFKISEDGKTAYISRSKDGSKDIQIPSLDVLDISSGFDMERIKSYYMPEADNVNSTALLDKSRMIISIMHKFSGFISVISSDIKPVAKNNTIKEAKNIDKSKPVWDLPFSQNGFASVSMAVSTEDGYILAGEYQNAREPDLFIKVDKSGREIWRKIVDKSYQGRAKLIAAQMQSYYVIGNEEATYVIDKATHKIINKLPYPLKHIAPTDNDEFIACDYKNNIFRMDKNAKIIWKKQIDVSHLQDEFYIKYEYDPKDPTKKPTQREIKKPKEGLEKLIKTDDGNFLLFVKEFGITKFNPNGKIIFESKVQTDGYFEDMLDDDGAALVLFRSKNKYNMKTLKLLKLNNEGKIITKSNVYGDPDHFFSPGFIKYKEGGYIIGIKPYNSQQIFLSEIDSKGRALDEGYITNLGTEVAFHKMLEMDDQKVLLLGSAVPKYKRSREAFMIMLNLNQIVNRLNLSIENR